MILLPVPVVVPQASSVTRIGAETVLQNGRIGVTVQAKTGRFGVSWVDQDAISGIVGEATLADGRTLRTDAAARHEIASSPVRDAFGRGHRVIVRHLTPGAPELRHVLWLYDGRPEAFVRLDIVGSKGTNSIVPVLSEAPRLAHAAPLRALFVPWDNDMYFRYRSDGWGEGEGDGDGSYEVGAVWDDVSRAGIVVGSVDHDAWKTAIRFRRNGDDLAGLRVHAGTTSKYTHDVAPHGTLTGRVVSSPRIVLGRYADWRDGLERYGDLNAIVRPPLAWKGGKPFFWNSWSGHKMKVSAEDARIATEFVATELPNFRSGGTAYVNFDAGSGNLKPEEMRVFIDRAHARGLKAGIYTTPFAAWGGLEESAGKGLTFRDLALKDAKGEPLPKLDGAYPLDPSHPRVLARIDARLDEIVAQGFDYVKMDFLSHGALEGRHHDPKIVTGTQAYNLGMRRISERLAEKRIGRPFFISLSIAPLFPHGWAHSRRVSCDVFANIGASEYLLNSANYAWWEAGRLYRFSDPDSATVFQAADEASTTEAEARTRVNASVVAGGMMILGDDLGKPEARRRVLDLFRNETVLDVARRASPFRPVDGDTDYAGGDLFVRRDGEATVVAAFNFSKDAARTASIPLARLGLEPGAWTARDLWTGASRPVGDALAIDLPPMSSTLLRLSRP